MESQLDSLALGYISSGRTLPKNMYLRDGTALVTEGLLMALSYATYNPPIIKSQNRFTSQDIHNEILWLANASYYGR